MAQAIATPGHGIPVGAALVQPEFPGEAPLVAVRIGADRSEGYSDALREIAGRLSTLASQQVTAKSEVETRWIEDISAYHGRYGESLIKSWKDAGQSTAYMKAARAKTIALEARLYDLIFPTDDKNWGIAPTPVPKLADEQKIAEDQATAAAAAATATTDPATEQAMVAAGTEAAQRAQAAKEITAKVMRAAKLMEEEMDDQLVETKYASQSRLLIHDLCVLGTGVLKGPMTKGASRGQWVPNGGKFEMRVAADDRPLMRRVDPWHFFPDASATSIDEAEFTFERYLWTKSDLRKMVRTLGFDPEAVRDLLREDRNRTVTDASLSNLVSLRSITEDSSLGQIKNRYIGWEYHGPLECQEIASILRAMGQEDAAKAYEEEDDPLKEHKVIVWFCDDVVLKITDAYPLDSNETLYSVGNLEEAEGTMFGYGITRIARDSEEALNSAWRMALDNSALSVGPQGVIDKTQIEPADGEWSFRPRKLWRRIRAAVAGDYSKPVEFFNVPNNMGEIKILIELASLFIDIETGIPQPQQGEQGTHTTPTVGGMAILQNAANIVFRRIVKNYDDQIITPTMRRLYDWNMQFNPREEIKGDMQVDARGTSVLLVKEVQATNLLMIVNQLLANPNIAPMLKAYPAVEKLFQAMMIKPADVMVGEDEYIKALQAMQSQPPPPSPAEISAQARIQSAQIAADVAKTRDDTALMIAQLRERTAMLELATQGDMTLAELRAHLEGKKMEIDSKERTMVAEAALERENAAEARARGEKPSGSGGYFSAGEDEE